MKSFFRYSAIITFCFFFTKISAQDLPLIPYPQKVEIKSGYFEIPKTISIHHSFSKSKNDKISFTFNLFNKANIIFIKNSKKNSQITFGLLPPKIEERHQDFYVIKIFPKEIIIESESEKGRFYAINTLSQLFSYYQAKGSIPCMEITDSPKFQWRGMHLDVSRHFFPKEFIKKYIDYLAMYKMNTFHWHLTDDQGWRIEIKKYPKLTEVGAWRARSMIGRYKDHQYEEKKYGGFYTQEDIKEIVKYASERHITIVPEIEMPGHASAAIAAYPELGCTGQQIKVAEKWGVFDDIFCPKEETFTFLENVLTEVMQLFPSKIIHIGGDEAPKTQWKTNEIAQALIKKEGLKDEHELQSYFIQRIEKFLNKHGREIIGWDEILEGGLAPNARVMSWRGEDGGIAASNLSHEVVMTPGGYCYFDHYQGNPDSEPIAFGGYTSTEKVYSYHVIPEKLTEDKKKFVLGSQGNVWTEYITTPEQVEYMVFPRITALSEVLWGTSTDFSNFKIRVQNHYSIWEKLKINFNKESINQPLNLPKK